MGFRKRKRKYSKPKKRKYSKPKKMKASEKIRRAVVATDRFMKGANDAMEEIF